VNGLAAVIKAAHMEIVRLKQAICNKEKL